MMYRKPAKMFAKNTLVAACTSATLLLGACATNGENDRTKSGALIGAVVGAAAGSTSGDEKGALLGAVAGALVGSAVGNYMDKQQQEIEAELAAEIEAEQIDIQRLEDETLRVSMSSEATFDIDSSALKPAFYPALDRLGGVMANYDKTVLHIIGHTDSTGSEQYNDALSRKRAVSVATYVRDNGVDRRRLNVEGRGEYEPRFSNASTEGRRANRRVEIYIKPVVEGDQQRALESPDYSWRLTPGSRVTDLRFNFDKI